VLGIAIVRVTLIAFSIATIFSIGLTNNLAYGGAIVAGTWYEFIVDFGTITGCQPADPLGLICVPSTGTPTLFADASPWTFTCVSIAGCEFRITDAFQKQEQFVVIDNNIFQGTTSIPAGTFATCGNDPVPCFADPLTSSGLFILGPGPHSIRLAQSLGLTSAAYFQFVELDPPVGGTLIPIDTTALLLAGVQSISMWMIPIIVASIGIGFVLVRRKF